MKFWLLRWPQNQVWKLAILEDYFEEEEEEEEVEEEAEEEQKGKRGELGGEWEGRGGGERGGGEGKQQQQQPASAEIAITNNGQQNQPNCSAVCVLLAAKERAQCARCDVGLCMVPVSRNIT